MSFSEIASEASEIAKSQSKSGFDVDKRAEILPGRETGGEKVFDPDKRVDISQNTKHMDSSDKIRPLTEEEKAYYRDKLGCSDGVIGSAKIDEQGIIHIKTRNEDKEGSENSHGVRFERKSVEINGITVEGVFPVFDSKLDVQLPKEFLSATDKEQFEYCTGKLKEAIKDPEFAKQFTLEQLEKIKNGDTPDGYTWHHNEDCGKMQLADSDVHQSTGHTGGRAIWGGGKENRH